MTPWWAYVTRIAGTVEQKTIAGKTGIGTSVLSRWSQGSHEPSVKLVVQFARAYGRSPIEALIAAGIVTPDEIDAVIELTPVPAADLDDAELLHEIARRLDVRRTEYERTLIQILVAVGQLQTYVKAMQEGEEEEEIHEVADHLGVLMYSLHQLTSMVVANPSRMKRMTAEAAVELRARQSGHVIADAARDDLVSAVTAWPFDYSAERQLQAGIEYVREHEILRFMRRRHTSTWETTADGRLIRVRKDEQLELPKAPRGDGVVRIPAKESGGEDPANADWPIRSGNAENLPSIESQPPRELDETEDVGGLLDKLQDAVKARVTTNPTHAVHGLAAATRTQEPGEHREQPEQCVADSEEPQSDPQAEP